MNIVEILAKDFDGTLSGPYYMNVVAMTDC